MTEIVAVGSFRGGTGKSTITSNLASYLASFGKKIVIIDTDIRSPGIHALFGLNEGHFTKTFTDYLFGKAKIEDVVYDVSETLDLKDEQLLLVPSSMAYGQITETLSAKRSHNMLRRAVQEIIDEYRPDYVFIDTHPGINEENLMTASFADKILTVVRPDSQDYQGVEVTRNIVKKLGKKAHIIMNKVHPKLNTKTFRKMLQERYGMQVSGALPFDENLMFSGSQFIFTLKNPEHKFSQVISRICENLFGVKSKERLDVTYDILSLLKKSKLSEKNLFKKMKLPQSAVKDYLHVLTKNKFVSSSASGLVLTTKGKEYLAEYHHIKGFIENFGL